jgi:hypothetical protein
VERGEVEEEVGRVLRAVEVEERIEVWVEEGEAVALVTFWIPPCQFALALLTVAVSAASARSVSSEGESLSP